MSCLFCELGSYPVFSGEAENSIIASTDSFYAKPGLGPLVEGYTLIIPRDHYINFSEMGKDLIREVSSLVDELSLELQTLYKRPVIRFEHGCSSSAGRGGACVEHAHLHLLPTDIDLRTTLVAEFPTQRINSLAGLNGFCERRKVPYIYYRGPDGQELLCQVARALPSQYIRRLLSKHIGCEQEWDWREFPFRERIESFRRAFASEFAFSASASPVDPGKEKSLSYRDLLAVPLSGSR